jgi:transposase
MTFVSVWKKYREPLTSTAIYGAVGNPNLFKNGREFAAWLGLVPKQHSTGGKARLQGISKRGDKYLRTNLIHGARSQTQASKKRSDARSRWVTTLVEKRGKYKAYVALANKNARIIWKLMASGETYRPPNDKLKKDGSAPTSLV